MDSPIEVITRGPFRIEIWRDDSHDNPRREYDHEGKFWTWESRTISPDPVPSWASPGEDLEEEIRERLTDVRMILPVFKYEHSGVIYRVSPFADPWDSGQAGVIIAAGPAFKDITDEEVTAWLTSEVDEYSAWANGEVYGYKVFRGEEEVDSCWGFIGSDHEKSGLMDQALANVKPATDEDGA